MDRFGVPNKVNRHVVKALKTLYKRKGFRKEESVRFSELLSEVKVSMRNLIPVRNLGSCVRRSLKNLEKALKTRPLSYTLSGNSEADKRILANFTNTVISNLHLIAINFFFCISRDSMMRHLEDLKLNGK